MLSANFKFKQSLSYTYFNYSSRSYIDHILVSEGIYNNVTSCAVLPHSDDNLSNHLPVKMTLNGVCDNVRTKSDTCSNDMYLFPKIDMPMLEIVQYIHVWNKYPCQFINKVN